MKSRHSKCSFSLSTRKSEINLNDLDQRFPNWTPRDFVRGAAKARESFYICRGSPRTQCLVSSPLCASKFYNGKTLSGRVAREQIT